MVVGAIVLFKECSDIKLSPGSIKLINGVTFSLFDTKGSQKSESLTLGVTLQIGSTTPLLLLSRKVSPHNSVSFLDTFLPSLDKLVWANKLTY